MGLIFESFSHDLWFFLLGGFASSVYYVYRIYTHWQRKGLECIAPTFPFGNFKETLLQRMSFGQLTCQMYNSTECPVLGIWSALRPAILVRDPEIINTILIKDFHMFHDRGVYIDEKADPLSGNLFSLSGHRWRHLRGKLSPTFTSGKLKAMFSTLVACGDSLDRFITNAADQQDSVEMRELMAQYTTNAIASIAFGIDIDCIRDPETEFRRFGRKIFVSNFINSLRLAVTFIWPKLMPWTKMGTVDQDVEDFFLDMTRQNMELRETKNVTREDFFQLLVQLRNSGSIQEDGNWETKITSDVYNKQMSIEECAAQAFLFYLGGFETSSTTAAFSLYELAKNPEIQHKVQDEIDEVLKQHNGQITYESVLAMKYLGLVVDETLRKYPPISIIVRESVAPWTIPDSNVTIDKGTPVFISLHALHHDPKYYPTPDRFIPERFGPELTDTPDKPPYMPFGEGPRNCIGMRLGKMQVKVALVIMLLKCEYELAGSSKLPMVIDPASFVLCPEGGINLKIKHRSK